MQLQKRTFAAMNARRTAHRADERDRIDFGQSGIGRLFLHFLLPTVLGMVSSAVFIVTDGIFVGRGVGSDALAAVNIVAPVYTLATGLGLMFGMGCSVVASIHLARGKQRIAGINVTQALIVPLLLLLAATAALLIGWRPMLGWLGTPESLFAPSREYYLYFVPFLVPLALFNILMFLVRLDDAPRFAMGCNLLAAGLNIVLDYLFIFECGWGLAGAAVATGIGYTLGTLLMLDYMLRRSRTLRPVRVKLSRRSLQLTLRNIGYMIYVGAPALLSELAISCMMIVGNYAFIRYVGKEGVAAYSIACYLFPIIFMIYSGIVQAAQPIMSYNYGAGLHARAERAFRLAILTAAGFGTLVAAATWLGGNRMAGLFLPSDAPAYGHALEGLCLFALGYPFFGINVAAIGYLQSLEYGKAAAGLTLLRGILLMALFFVVLPIRWGETGIWLAVPAAECCVALLLAAVWFSRRHRHTSPLS